MTVPFERRSGFKLDSICHVDLHLVRPSQISVRSMNFGQHWRTEGERDFEYFVAFPVQLFFDVLAREAPAFVKDAILNPDKECALENIQRNRGWPSVDQVLADHKIAALWLEYLAHTLLLEWFGDGEPESEPGYVTNTVERAIFDPVRPVLCGQGERTLR